MDLFYEIVLLYLATGIVGGFLAGLLGIGGGLVIVPAFAFIFHLKGVNNEILMHLAVGSSLGSMVVTTFFSSLSHYLAGVQILPLFPILLRGLLPGAILGGIIADFLPSTALAIFFGLFLWLLASHFIFDFKVAQRDAPLHSYAISLVALIIGTFSSMLGIGGGVMMVPFLTYCKKTIHEAIGISACCSFAIAVMGAVTFLLTGLAETNLPPHTLGYIYWPAVVGVSLTSPFSTWFGAKTAHWLPVSSLKKVFALLLVVVGARMLFF